ncbi:DNA recombination/repair protein RecA, partial [Vibrio cholerae O1]|nr:DNA recombination/repair protein RecA [Vibrio cholerae O1]
EGISKTGELLTIAVEEGIVKKAGAWFSYNDEKIGQGAEKAKAILKDNPEIFDEIDRKVRQSYGLIEGSE